MLKFKIKESLLEKGVLHPFTWLHKVIHLGPSTAKKLLNNEKESITLKDLDALCRLLDCTPNDLFYYVQDGRQEPLEPDHALHTLKAPDTLLDWPKILNQLPPNKIAAMTRQLNKEIEDNG
jgi:putative transcriptional regulator